MPTVIPISPRDTQESSLYAARRYRFDLGPVRSRNIFGLFQITNPVISTAGTAVVVSAEYSHPEFQLISETNLEAIEDELDVRDSLEALAEARETGTKSHEALKAELGL